METQNTYELFSENFQLRVSNGSEAVEQRLRCRAYGSGFLRAPTPQAE